MDEQIKTLLEGLKTQVAEKTAAFEGLESKTAQLIADAEAKLKTANEAEIAEIKTAFDARIDALVAEMKSKKQTENGLNDFAGAFSSELKTNEAKIDLIQKGQKLSFELKEATIETSATVTGVAVGAGGAVINQNGATILPSPLVNFSNLVRTVSGVQDTLRLWRETVTANTIARQAISPAVLDKPEQDFTAPPVDFTASYLAGVFRFHKSLLRNLPWMQQRLPEMLRRNFLKKENAEFFAYLKANVTTYTGSKVGVEALVEAIGLLESADFGVNGVVINPIDWATISATKSTEGIFTLPGTVTFINGQLTINGVPVYKASFVPVNNFMVGDWTQAYKYVTDGLKVEMYEQDADNVQKNAITARVEESNVLVLEQPAAFIWGELDGATPSV